MKHKFTNDENADSFILTLIMAAIAFFNAFVQLTVMNTILTHFKNIFNKFDTNFQGGGLNEFVEF